LSYQYEYRVFATQVVSNTMVAILNKQLNKQLVISITKTP